MTVIGHYECNRPQSPKIYFRTSYSSDVDTISTFSTNVVIGVIISNKTPDSLFDILRINWTKGTS